MINLKNTKIGTQLKIGFAAILFFVILLGVTSHEMNDRLFQQTETMYDHPLQVRRIIRTIDRSAINMRMNIRDFLLIQDEASRQTILNEIALNKLHVLTGIENLRKNYLGPQTDVDDLLKEFTKWVAIRDESVRIAASGRLDEARLRHKPEGIAPTQALKVFAALEKISDYAQNKGDELYVNSKELDSLLNEQLFFMVGTILLLSLFLMYTLLRNIREPLGILTEATRKFRNGDMSARSSYESKNEFGVLAASFNAMAESVQVNIDLDQKVAHLASLMLSKYDPKEFFQETITALASHTGSQMAAVYLLSEDKKTFDHFESTGIDNNARQSFSATNFEGEFGTVLSSRKIQHIKNIAENTRFVFHTVSGKFIPNEIITIPIIANNETVAVISLASIGKYSSQSIKLIDNILVTMCARVEGIIAYHKIRKFLLTLENQNRELETQKSELASQSAELMEQNTELEMQKNQLDEASRLKTSFLSNMSHELRTPLNSVIALSGVLNRRLVKQIPEEEFSYIEVIERNGRHLLALINDILDISRIESGREEIEVTEFNICDLGNEVVSMIKPTADEKGIELLKASENCDIFITSDADKCRHILQNLIGNAVKFTEKGSVKISVNQTEKDLEITIKDTGIGISEKNLPHIFDEFRQADGSTSRRFGGTGLGLAIAKKYANMLGGKISVKSVLGEGSEFLLRLPLKYSAENRIIDPKTPDNFKFKIRPATRKLTSDLSVKTILLVEDSEPAIIQLNDILEESCHNILVARDGRQALEIIDKTIPDAIILDLMMPDIDGFEVLKTLRNAEPTAHIPVLILTAKQITKEELRFLKRNNIHQLIQKGDVNREELLKTVKTMLFPVVEKTVTHCEMPDFTGRPVILVVEDNPDNMITVKALLSENYSVIEAVNGKEGVKMAKKYKPDMILMDIALPEMDGIEAFNLIKKDEDIMHIPVIALTASAMTSEKETILAHGFDAYIAKPIDEPVFFKTINEVLHGK